LDQEHCIGHSYFFGIHELPDLIKAFKYKVLPLLKEYFYGNHAKIRMVLGPTFVEEKSKAEFPRNSMGEDGDDDKAVFEFVNIDKFTAEQFKSIYA
jgi:5-methylcytosine-specific restriction protein B